MITIVIPTYKRYELLQEKTLKTLKDAKVPAKIIHIFVADEDEAVKYRASLDKSLYGKIVVGVKGITAQRKFIVSYYPIGEKIVSIDDDVCSIMELDKNKKLQNIKDLYAFFNKAFVDLKKHKLYLFGLYATPNPFYMLGQPAVTTNLKFIIATVYGFINRHDKDLVPHVPEKEDVELTLACFVKDGGVLRYNYVSFKTKFKNALGGLGGIEKRFDANKYSAEYLVKKYPKYTRIKIRKNGMYEIVLREYKYPATIT
jgi:hypothetical protein